MIVDLFIDGKLGDVIFSEYPHLIFENDFCREKSHKRYCCFFGLNYNALIKFLSEYNCRNNYEFSVVEEHGEILEVNKPKTIAFKNFLIYN